MRWLRCAVVVLALVLTAGCNLTDEQWNAVGAGVLAGAVVGAAAAEASQPRYYYYAPPPAYYYYPPPYYYRRYPYSPYYPPYCP